MNFSTERLWDLDPSLGEIAAWLGRVAKWRSENLVGADPDPAEEFSLLASALEDCIADAQERLIHEQ